ncbi:hypothetical protein [Pseudonocardia xinjiangensis]|uniref:hypothetical protein n=1 Tax=Pseudonocardia xinjiangensis TaxID=75289 RepID=UPI001B7CF4FA|nr:hypothetical protein [Pseudonocardia xinjiangensis]
MEAIVVSNAARWLASDEARYVTGVALPVDVGAAAPFTVGTADRAVEALHADRANHHRRASVQSRDTVGCSASRPA